MNSSSTPRTYRVPQRFGLGAMLAFTTLFAMVFGVLRFYDAPVEIYLFFLVLVTAICGAQMYRQEVPRFVSIVTGAICLPLFLIVATFSEGREAATMGIIGGFPCYAVFGGLIGYLTGTLAAGVFLVGDLIEQRLRGRRVVNAEVIDEPALPPGTPVYSPDSCTPYLSEEAAHMTTDSEGAPRVKKVGPPIGVPVYNCVALISPRSPDGLVHARAANLANLRTSGASEREALQHLVGAFKIVISQCLAEGREPPLLPEPEPPAPGETQRFIAVHL